MILRRFILLALLLALPGIACAQGSRKDDIVLNRYGQPVAGASVTVCASGATGTPCTPLAGIFSDVGLTQPLANPLTSDGQGNYHFYATPGRYMIQISGAGAATTTIPDVLLAADPTSPSFQSLTVTQNISALNLNLSGNLSVSGGVSSPATVSAPQQGSASPVQIGPHWYAGTATGKVTPPSNAPAVSLDSSSGGGIAAGTYYFKITYVNENGETTASPSRSITVSGSTNRILVAVGDILFFTGAPFMRVYASTDNVNFYAQTPWSVSTNIASPGGCVRASNVVTCTVASGYFPLTPNQKVTVANVPNGTTSFNGTFTVTAVNSTSTTFSYNQTAANDTSGTGTGTVSYFTGATGNGAAASGNLHYAVVNGGPGFIMSSLTFSGTQPPSTNTATIDPLQVAVNAARGGASYPVYLTQYRLGSVLMPAGVTTLTTPLILGDFSPCVIGQSATVAPEGGAAIGRGGGSAIRSAWDDAATGAVMVMGQSACLRDVTVYTDSGDTSAILFTPGDTDMNGQYMNGVVAYNNSNYSSTIAAAIKAIRMTSSLQWNFTNVTTASGFAGLYIANSSGPVDLKIDFGRHSCVGTNVPCRAFVNDGGPTDYDHGVNFGGFPGGSTVSYAYLDTESTSGAAWDGIGSLTLDHVTNSDANVAAGTPAAAYYGRGDHWSGVPGLVVTNSTLFGNTNANATVSWNTNPGTFSIENSIVGISSYSGSNVAINFNNLMPNTTRIENSGCMTLNASDTVAALLTNITFDTHVMQGFQVSGLSQSCEANGTTSQIHGFVGKMRLWQPLSAASSCFGASTTTSGAFAWNGQSCGADTGIVDASGNLSMSGTIGFKGIAGGSSGYTMTGSPTSLRTITWPDASGTVGLVLTGTTGSLGGSALGAGACTSTTVSITGATTSMTASVSPAADPGAGFSWMGFVSSSGTVTVRLCAIAAGTPTSTTYNVRVIQ
jgi:hypothetical protein